MSGVDMLILSGAALVLAIVYFRSSGKTPASLVASVVNPSTTSGLATTMAALDDQASDRAYEAVSNQLVGYLADKKQKDLLDALAPKATAQPPSQ